MVEESISKFSETGIKFMQSENRTKRMKETEYSLREMWDTNKHTIIHMMGNSRGREERERRRKIFK